MKRIIALMIVLVMVVAAIPMGTMAEWVEPVPASKTDDEFWHVTYDFKEFWAENFDQYEPGNSNREPDILAYKDKLWILWEGILVPNRPEEPVAYKGKLYLRSYTDRSGEPEWGDIIEITPNAYYSDHTNQKGRLIVYKDKLYTIWQSNDRNQKPQGHPEYQFDILVRSYDGNEMDQFTPPDIISRKDRENKGGFDQWPIPVVYKDKLYVVWFWEDLEAGISDILYRAYDGTTWSDINVLSKFPNNNTKNLFPHAHVWKDRLYVTWQETGRNAKVTEAVYAYTEDGETWSAVSSLSREIDKSSISIDLLTYFATYNNPKTSKEELHVFWRTYKTENTHGGFYDFDLVSRVWDGDTWSPTREISPQYDKWDDTYVNAIEYEGKLHIIWSTKDNSVSDGKDYDIVRVIYDGETYTEPEILSRIGDRDEVLFDDNEWWNEGDDQWPRTATYPNAWGEDRLYVVFWSFDHISGCCADDPDGAQPTIVVKLVEDTDHDADGVPDQRDECDEDPEGWRDSDGDTVCDETDWKPHDPDVWEQPEDGDDRGDALDPLPIYLALVIIIVAAVALLSYRGSKKKPRPANHDKSKRHDEEE